MAQPKKKTKNTKSTAAASRKTVKEPEEGVISGMPRHSEEMTVQKSNPLLSLWRSELSLAEFKILDTYLARIDSSHPEKRTVHFEKGEIEKLLGVGKINTSELKSRLRHLMSSVVELADKRKPKGFALISLFSMAVCSQDDSGLWQIEMNCTDEAMEYIFEPERIGYLRYKLRCITQLRSRYSYILFLYLEQNRFRVTWEVELDALKMMLSCDVDDSYAEFKEFNRSILKRCQKELAEKAGTVFEYEPIREARKVTKIRFRIHTLSDIALTDENGLILTEGTELANSGMQKIPDADFRDVGASAVQEEKKGAVTADGGNGLLSAQLPMHPVYDAEEYADENIRLLADACGYEFSNVEMEELTAILAAMQFPVPDKVGDVRQDIWTVWYQYLMVKYAALNRAEERAIRKGGGITSRFLYLRKMLMKEQQKKERPES